MAARLVKHQSMSRTVGQLDAEGWIKRTPDPDDGPKVGLEITEAGLGPRHRAEVRRAG